MMPLRERNLKRLQRSLQGSGDPDRSVRESQCCSDAENSGSSTQEEEDWIIPPPSHLIKPTKLAMLEPPRISSLKQNRASSKKTAAQPPAPTSKPRSQPPPVCDRASRVSKAARRQKTEPSLRRSKRIAERVAREEAAKPGLPG
ncbi:hypothetical protein B0I35DRAFT_279171 [Stachybotrys elegans]|uniref:Uncharacterized protein n=1 Tax=Stachybotrys elegans TaxID=80388 RepID=A0A8K0SMH2_9HYPO|nr:hypothetical protein B0I35DRAFT_279171 [Stachybotrys elegans]